MNDVIKKAIKKIGLFDGIVGQERAKKQLNFFIDSYYSTRRMPNTMFNASKGQGKTTIAREVARGLVKFDDEGKIEMNEQTGVPKRKPFMEINCSTLKTVDQFINGLIVPYVQEKDITLLFDEASCIPKDISMALLTILNPNPEGRTSFSYKDYTCDFDSRKQTFLFATTEPQGVFHALLDRLTRIELEEYTSEEMGRILQKGCPEVEFEDGVITEIASVLRGNARAAQKMSENILTYLKNRKKFSSKDWVKLKEIFGIYPLGLSPVELSLLKLLKENNTGTSLTNLAAKTGLSRDALQKDYEMYLQKHGLMDIETTGRFITAKGLEYLQALSGNPVFRSSVVQ